MKKLIYILFLTAFFGVSCFSQSISGTFKTTVQNTITYNYLLHKPETKTQKPLIIFLHGSGERGSDIEKIKVHGPFKYLKNNTLEAFVLAPQCPENTYWESESLYQLIQKICKENTNIDTNRIYLTGLSMGAWGAWNLVFAHPEMFAAFVPIAGFVDRVPMVENCKIKHIPTYIFHGLLDDVVTVNYAIEIYKKLKPCSLNIELTIFDDANHDSWSRVYDDSKIYEWMFQQIKK
jgi:predicted peptidase